MTAPYHTLRSFVDDLESRGDLKRISCEVDPVLEVSEIAARVFRAQGPALLFENVQGSRFPLLLNPLGTRKRLVQAFGRTADEIGDELKTVADTVLSFSPSKAWNARQTLRKIFHLKPIRAKKGVFYSHQIAPPDLGQLPITQLWPDDGGRFVTFPLVITKSPLTGQQNVGIYRMHVYNAAQTGLHWQIAKGGGYHYQEAEKLNQPLPVAVAVGVDPALMLAGVLPLPEGLDEMRVAGFLRGQGTRVTRVSGGLSVPAEAEFLMEGLAKPGERRTEGPFGDHFGHYSAAAPFPVFQVQNLWHRAKPIFQASVVGKPPMEDRVMGDAIQEILLPLLKVMRPEISDLWAYMEAGFHNLCVVSVRQRFEKEAMKTALWLLGEGQLALTKCVILVDENVNARDFPAVLRALKSNFDPAEDFLLLPRTSQDTLDFTGVRMNLGSKMVLDATSKPSRKKPPAAFPTFGVDDARRFDSRVVDGAVLGDALLVLKMAREGRAVLEKLALSKKAAGWPLVAVVSEDVPLSDSILLLWGLFTRFDAARDTFFADVSSTPCSHPRPEGPLFIDAMWKEGYPKPVQMSEDIIRLVDKRWKEYGL